MGRYDRSYDKDVYVRCLTCGTEYIATVTVHEIVSDESESLSRHDDPPSRLCPQCNDYRKEKV